MAEEAIRVKPVSGSEFPVWRVSTGNFAVSGPDGLIRVRGESRVGAGGGTSRRPRILPFVSITPRGIEGRDAQPACDLQQRSTAACERSDRLSLELIRELTPSVAQSTPSRSPRSLAKVSTTCFGGVSSRALFHLADLAPGLLESGLSDLIRYLRLLAGQYPHGPR